MRSGAASRLRERRAPRGPLVDERAQPSENGGVGLREDAVAEVEEVPGAARGSGEHVERRRLDPLPGAEEDGGIEIPLHAALEADLVPAAVEVDPPVEADHVAAGGGHVPEEGSRPRAEVDRRSI